MRKVLTSGFFHRPTLMVAKELLGKHIVREINGKRESYLITETEAYVGFGDLASHARAGKTARTAPMFMPGGTLYVYFTYGMHWMLNFVTGKEGVPGGVLIRGAGTVVGPGRLAKELKLDKTFSGLPLGKAAGLWVEDRGVVIAARDIARAPRIGIPNAGAYKDKLWRFVLKNKEKYN